jgi:hypothetical protein
MSATSTRRRSLLLNTGIYVPETDQHRSSLPPTFHAHGFPCDDNNSMASSLHSANIFPSTEKHKVDIVTDKTDEAILLSHTIVEHKYHDWNGTIINHLNDIAISQRYVKRDMIYKKMKKRYVIILSNTSHLEKVFSRPKC